MNYEEKIKKFLISGGPWDIRLVCTEDNFLQVLDVLKVHGSRFTRLKNEVGALTKAGDSITL
ncbi:MAG: hypothetical protein U5L00_18975 [Desulfovermiculus sp.]|nr:hypothetical protein [Desulfovermiculus sp.]